VFIRVYPWLAFCFFSHRVSALRALTTTTNPRPLSRNPAATVRPDATPAVH
jgi:hypothetical protein